MEEDPTRNGLEEEYVDSVRKRISDPEEEYVDYIRRRIFEYGEEAKSNERWYNWLSTISYVLPLLVPIFTFIDGKLWAKVLASSLVVVGSALAGIVTRFRFHDNMINKRLTAFKLSSELMQYHLKMGRAYNANDNTDRGRLKNFQATCQLLIADDLAIWEKIERERAAIDAEEAPNKS